MFPLDIRTIFFGYLLTNAVNLVLMASLYLQIKNRFAGTKLLLISFTILFIGDVQMFLQGMIPNWISIVLSNSLVAVSQILILISFEKFLNLKSKHTYNYIYLSLFVIVHSYFTFINNDVNARMINVAILSLVFGVQIAYLMLIKTPESMRNMTRPIGIVFVIVVSLQIIHIGYILENYSGLSDYFKSKPYEPYFLLVWETLFLLLVYTITLMYNKRLIMNVNAQEEKFSKAFHSAPFIVLISKFADGQIFEVNRSVLPISGFKPSELVGLKTTDLKLWKNESDRNDFIEELNTFGFVKEKEITGYKKSGEVYTGLLSAETIDINGEKCIISILNDITNRKKIEIKLLKSETSLKELISTKDKFFSIMAHDLKSPFNSIVGFSELLRDQVLQQDYEGIVEYTEIITKSSHHAMNLLSNLMEWSRSQTGRMEFNPEYVDIILLIKEVTELLKAALLQKSITLTLNTPHDLIINADKAMLETVLRNLISNAIKFTPTAGKIIITAEQKQNECEIIIEDNGIGIDKKHIDTLFSITNAHSSPSTENETGTGLGLILCKDFIEKHNGKIWVESTIDVGSKFYFTLPKR